MNHQSNKGKISCPKSPRLLLEKFKNLSLELQKKRRSVVTKKEQHHHRNHDTSGIVSIPTTTTCRVGGGLLSEFEIRQQHPNEHEQQQQHYINYGHPTKNDSNNKKNGSIDFDPNECLQRFQIQATESIRYAYQPDQSLRRATSSGALTTSLPEDVMSLLQTFLSVLDSCYISNNKHAAAGTGIYSNNGTTRNYESYFLNGLLHVIRAIRTEHCACRWNMVGTSSNSNSNSTTTTHNNNVIEDLCAAANDFFRLSEKMEQFVTNSILEKNKYPFLIITTRSSTTDENNNINQVSMGSNRNSANMNTNQLSSSAQLLINECYELVHILFHDAVSAAERCPMYIIRTIQNNTTIADDLFTSKWEDVYTSNQIVNELIRAFDEPIRLMEKYLFNEFLFHKTIIVSVKSMVCFYIRCLIVKAEAFGRTARMYQRSMGLLLRQSLTDIEPFHNHRRALIRMKDDIAIMSTYFQNKIVIGVGTDDDENEDYDDDDPNHNHTNKSALVRIITNEMWILEVIHEYLQVTSSASTSSTTMQDHGDHHHANDSTSPVLSSSSPSSLESFIVVLHKRTGANTMVTKYLVSDLWLLSKSQLNQRQLIRQTIDQIQPDLQMVTIHMHQQQQQQQQTNVKASKTTRAHPHSHYSMGSSTVVPMGQLEEMLQSLYTDRMVQGLLPLCWICLPRQYYASRNDDKNGMMNDDTQEDCRNNRSSKNGRNRQMNGRIYPATQLLQNLQRHILEIPPPTKKNQAKTTTTP